MDPIKVIKGFRPLHFIGNQILFSKGFGLYLSDELCEKFTYIGKIPHSFGLTIKSLFRWSSRIFRSGAAPGCVLSEKNVLLFENRRIWLVDVEKKSIDIDHLIQRGSRPLSIAFLDDILGFERFICCYGEYWENVPKDEVRIWGRGKDGIWHIAYTFPEGIIEHVHAIIPDKERDFVWILTGDFENGAGLWKATDNFSCVEPVLVGQQDYRSVWLFFSGGDIYYATDSQLEKNSFRKLVINDTKFSSDFVSSIPGSSIYACVVGDSLYFSTTVEPGMPKGRVLYDLFDSKIGPGIESDKAVLFVWSQGSGLQKIMALKKDILPPRLFQFGSFSFPLGNNPIQNKLFTYVTALSKYDGCTIVFDLEELSA